MKKLTILCSFLILFSCSKDIESFNKDIKHVTEAAPQTYFANGVKNLTDLMSTLTRNQNTWRILSQYLTENTYLERTNYFISADGIPDNVWNILYIDVLKNLDESAKTLSALPAPTLPAEAIQRKNQLAIVEIMTVYTYSILVETFGNIPYSEALNFENVLPRFDDQKMVYVDLIARLGKALDNLNTSAGSFGTSDLYYSGDVSKWIKFGNSMRLRMGLRIIDADPALGATTVRAALGKVFTSNSDNAVIKYLTASPNLNPMWYLLVQEKREYFVSTKRLVDMMNSLNDPRRAVFLSTVQGRYVGSEYGIPISYAVVSHMGERFYSPTQPGIVMDYASVEFLLAEAAERQLNGTPSDAESHYNKAVRASFDYYQVSGADTYLSQPAVAYSTAPGSWKQKIGNQKWLALYNQGYEAWTEYRRLDYPVLTPGPNALVPTVPARFPYPISEQSRNRANYEDAASAVGGDVLTTKLFWDIH